MGKRCKIGMLNSADRSVDAIYLHNDRNTLEILNNHFNDIQSVNKLIALGGLAELGENLELPEGITEIKDIPNGYTFAYHRDRGEKLEIQHYNSSEEFQNYNLNEPDSDIESVYIWINGRWFDYHRN